MGSSFYKFETDLSSCRKNSFAITMIFIIVLMTYSNTFHASWHFDDEKFLDRKTLHLTEFKWPQIKKTLFQEESGFSRPISCLSLALNYYFGKDNVFGYHLINLLIHFLASVFLFLLISHTLRLPLLSEKYGRNAYSIALLSTILWTINPIQTQAVTYIIQRMASMAGMFYIMAMYLYLRGRTCERRILKLVFYITFLLCGMMAFGSKENAVMLPISISLFDLFLIQGLNKQNVKKNTFILLALILFFAAILLIIKGPSTFHPKHLLSGYDHRPFTLLERLLTEPRVILFYISLLLYPMPNRLCLTHDISISHDLFNPLTTVLSIFTIFMILGLSLIKSKRWPFISYCIIFFFLNHLIESSILPLELTFEHRNYLPSMLFFAPFTILILKVIQVFSTKSIKLILNSFIILVLIGHGHSAFVRNAIWKTEESLWFDCIEKYPDLWRPFHNLGRYYSETGQNRKAIIMYNKALHKKIANDPGQHIFLTYFNLGVEHFRIDHYDKALYYYRKTESIHPNFGPLQNNIGLILLKQKRYREAEIRFKKALTYQSDLPEALSNLGLLLMIKGDLPQAMVMLKKAIQIAPDSYSALMRISRAYMESGRYGKALIYARRALGNDSSNHLGLLFLAQIYHVNGSKRKMEQTIQTLLKSIQPDQIRHLIETLDDPQNLDALLLDKDLAISVLAKAPQKK